MTLDVKVENYPAGSVGGNGHGVGDTTQVKYNGNVQNASYASPLYSPVSLRSYNRERHFPLDDAIKAVFDLGESESLRLKEALDRKAIKVYEFNGKNYLDRLDVGRSLHEKNTNKEGLTIGRYFTEEGQDINASAGLFKPRTLEIKHADGKSIFNMDNALFPEYWSDTDAKVVAQKYFFRPNKQEWKDKLKAKIGEEYEHSFLHLVNRVTHFFADEGERGGYFKTPEDKKNFTDELKWLQLNRKVAFNSPVQFNAGLHNEYGVAGSSGINYWRNPDSGEVVRVYDGCNVRPQCHACFIKGPTDDLESIVMQAVHEAGIFSSGSGIGQEIGVLREEGAPLSSGGEASGPISFFRIYDDCAGTIKSGGKSRRAARMTTMRIYHPDIMKFIASKVNEEKKIKVLLEEGYSGGMEGEAVTSASFQNTNISVRADSNFFEQVEKGGNIDLISVASGERVKSVSADRVLKEVSYGSWRCGDPAFQYETKIQEMHTCKNSGRQNSTNPCSEYLFLDDTSCNLASLNLLSFCDDKGNFHVESFRRAARIVSIAQDIQNDAASYPVEDIARISPEFRTIGLNYSNLGALLMRKGLAYDSDDGRAFAAAVTAILTASAYEASAEMAEKLEPFIHYEFNKCSMIEVIERHKRSLDDVVWDSVPGDLKQEAYDSWESVLKKGKAFGFRNAQTTVLAPTGTVSFYMGCDTTGGEPSIALAIEKNLAGGGVLTLVNQEVPNALKNLGYNEKQVKDIFGYVKENNSVIGAPHLIPDQYEIFDTAFGDGKGNGSLSFEGHVKMLGAMQPFISGAISKTNNLPEEATVKDIYDGYLLGHKLGLKALAVFRNNSKCTSALSFGARGFKKLERGEAEDLPDIGPAHIARVRIGDVPMNIIFGEYPDGRLGEIYFASYKTSSTVGSLLEVEGVTVSRALKRGVGLEDVLAGWLAQGFEPKGFITGYPWIKNALSPLDAAAKIALIEYMGRVDLAMDPEKVDVENLRGFNNGAFRTYERAQIDSWNIDSVLRDPEFGGFEKVKTESTLLKTALSKAEHSRVVENKRGVACRGCGNMMLQTAPNCFICSNCGDKYGGCGQ